MPKIIAREIKLAVLKAFEHYKNDRPVFNNQQIINGLSDMYGVSEWTIRQILKDGLDNLKISVPGKPKKKDIFTNYIFRKDLQRLIWQYNLKNEYFTLEFKGGRTTLFKIMKSMGYC